MLFEAQAPWTVTTTPLFEASLRAHLRVFPDLREKLAKFIDTKIANPLASRYGKHDRAFTGPLVGFNHCHLRDDAILIYNLKNRSINLVCIVSHSEIEGKRMKAVISRIAPYK